MVLALLIIMGASATAFAADIEPVTLELDGQVIETEVPPTIIQGRTMVPAKFLFEAMGGTVDWMAESRQVKVVLRGTAVLLTIDSQVAFVNGIAEEMDVAPVILNQRTLIPAAFVSEKLGCTVNWINETRTVRITSPPAPEKTQVTAVTWEEDDEGYRVVVQANGQLGGYKSYAYDSPDRFVLDIANVKMGIDTEGEEGSVDINGQVLTRVRFSQFEEATVRVVADLEEQIPGKISLSEDKHTLFIEFGKEAESPGETEGQGNADDPALEAMDIPSLDWRAQSKLIFIDPGHGGTDSGSLAYDENKAVIAMEKDLNLSIALRLNQLLKAAGANTYILREGDESISLYERPAIANSLNADLYVSVHNNSSDYASPNGTETLYYNKPTDSTYGYTSKAVADAVQAELVKNLGLKNRGTKNSPMMAVLNRSEMPAIIIEGAFLSNASELAYIMTDEFKEAYAVAAARGIIKALNTGVKALQPL